MRYRVEGEVTFKYEGDLRGSVVPLDDEDDIDFVSDNQDVPIQLEANQQVSFNVEADDESEARKNALDAMEAMSFEDESDLGDWSVDGTTIASIKSTGEFWTPEEAKQVILNSIENGEVRAAAGILFDHMGL